MQGPDLAHSPKSPEERKVLDRGRQAVKRRSVDKILDVFSGLLSSKPLLRVKRSKINEIKTVVEDSSLGISKP